MAFHNWIYTLYFLLTNITYKIISNPNSVILHGLFMRCGNDDLCLRHTVEYILVRVLVTNPSYSPALASQSEVSMVRSWPITAHLASCSSCWWRPSSRCIAYSVSRKGSPAPVRCPATPSTCNTTTTTVSVTYRIETKAMGMFAMISQSL